MPGIMSGLKWEFLARVVVTTAFNDPLLQAVMKGVAKLPSTRHRVRLPSTLHFGLTGKWFNTQSIRMPAPTIAAAANAKTRVILQMGRWASEPAALLYQHQSTTANNNMLSINSDPTLFTTDDILLSRVLASRAPDHQPTIRRYA